MKGLALSFLLMASMIAQAADYYGMLTAKMGSESEEQEKTVTLVQSSGKYTLTIRNVTVENAGSTVGIGTVVISDIAGSTGTNGYTNLSASGTTSIQNGDDPTVSTWWGPTLGSAQYVLTGKVKSGDLTFSIDITAPLLGKIIVSFETLEVYPVKINGVQLTSGSSGSKTANFGGALKAGTVTYVPNVKQLTLSGVTIEAGGVYPAIEINTDTIHVLAIGTNTVKQTAADDDSGTNTRNALQFKGNYMRIWYGRLDLESECSAALLLNNTHDVEATVEVDGATLNATSNGKYDFTHGIVGSIEVGVQPYNATLKLTKANVTAAASKSKSKLIGAVGGFKDIELVGTVLRNPAGGKYMGDAGFGLFRDGNAITYYGTVEWGKAKSYNLEVAGVEVNEANKDDLYEYLPLESGMITYDDETNTLTLDWANMDLTENHNIINYYGTEELTIEVIGSNVLRNDYEGMTMSGICTFSPITVISDDLESNVLTVYSNKATFKTYDKDITLDNIRFMFNGEIGIDNEFYSSAPNAVLKANKAWGTFSSYRSNSGVNGFADMKLIGCEVSTPDNGYYDTDQYRFLNSDGTLCYRVTINLTTPELAGDVNGDGEVNVTDVVGLANHVMGDTPNSFVLGNADVNGDGDVNVTDVVKLANLVMGI